MIYNCNALGSIHHLMRRPEPSKTRGVGGLAPRKKGLVPIGRTGFAGSLSVRLLAHTSLNYTYEYAGGSSQASPGVWVFPTGNVAQAKAQRPRANQAKVVYELTRREMGVGSGTYKGPQKRATWPEKKPENRLRLFVNYSYISLSRQFKLQLHFSVQAIQMLALHNPSATCCQIGRSRAD
jgi:hypothetical protein